MNKYYSNAKLLLTGEYLVLHGALAFAVPLKFGQKLEIFETKNQDLEWKAFEKKRIWLEFSISNSDIEMQFDKGETEKDFVCFLLNRARFLNSNFLTTTSFRIRTEINFNRNWGLGSSSTLINNVAQWANVNPYELHSLVSNGSGYDIACANYCKPILFRREGIHPSIYPKKFAPYFTKQLYFLYLGKKEKSEESVRIFLDGKTVGKEQVELVSQLSKDIVNVVTEQEFDSIVERHEELVADLLKRERVKQIYFPDFDGVIKSLGAWGGDFVMLRSDLPRKEIQRYFSKRGLNTLFSWGEIILGSI